MDEGYVPIIIALVITLFLVWILGPGDNNRRQ